MPSGDAEQPKGGLGDEFFSSIRHHHPAWPFIAVCALQLETLPKKKMRKGVDRLLISLCFLALDICPIFPGLNNLITGSQNC